jgi:hypothetical protein
MKRTLILLLILTVAPILMLAVALYVPSSLPTNSDFDAIYFTDLALVHGINIYDIQQITQLAAEQMNVSVDRLFLPRFPYPPWYALATFYLGFLPIQGAATLWFELNLLMLFSSVWLLTRNWPPRSRLISFPLALFLLPVIGTLSVGQYDFPILLGAALMIYGLRVSNIALTTLSASLLTFKPHVGGLILLAALIHLFLRRDRFGRVALASILEAVVMLFAIGFIADRAWPIHYLNLLLSYRNEGNVTSCSECASLPILLARALLGQSSLAIAILIGAVLVISFLILIAIIRPPLWRTPPTWLAAVVLITLLVNPYLYNYDFMLLLIPLFVCAAQSPSPAEWILIGLAYIIPLPAIILLGRQGNPVFVIATFLLVIVMALQLRRIDAANDTAYNQR